MRVYLSCKHGKTGVLRPALSNQFRMPGSVPEAAPAPCVPPTKHLPTASADVIVGSVAVETLPPLVLPVYGPGACAPARDRVEVCGDDRWESRFFMASLITACLPPLPQGFCGPVHPTRGVCA